MDAVVATTRPTGEQTQSWVRTHVGLSLAVYHRPDLTAEFLHAIRQHVATVQDTGISISEFTAYGPPSYCFMTRGRKAGG